MRAERGLHDVLGYGPTGLAIDYLNELQSRLDIIKLYQRGKMTEPVALVLLALPLRDYQTFMVDQHPVFARAIISRAQDAALQTVDEVVSEINRMGVPELLKPNVAENFKHRLKSVITGKR